MSKFNKSAWLILLIVALFTLPFILNRMADSQAKEAPPNKIVSKPIIKKAGAVKPIKLLGEHYMVEKSDAEWQKTLTPQQYDVLRKHGTERPFTGQYDHFYKEGRYICAACGHVLFDSETKFDSKTGWPSFYAPTSKAAVGEKEDRMLGMSRTEFHCARCGGHLGHVFPDGPKPTGLRYCTNSVSLKFVPEKDK